jgi:hypothetical protein
MFGNQKPNVNKAMQKMAQQRLMRGNAHDANLMNSFGAMGNSSASHALSHTLRNNKNSGANSSAVNNNSNTQALDAKKRLANNMINSVSKSTGNSNFGSSILGAIGR